MKLTTLQQCVNDVQLRGDHPPLTQNEMVSFRVNTNVLKAAEDICKAHTVPLSAYLRKCLENLARDYRAPDVQE